MTKLKLVLLISFCYCISANAQAELTKTVVAGSGGNFSNGALSLSSTVAEMTMVTTLSGGTEDLFQGFQNSAWMIQEVYVSPVVNNDLTVSLYPSPAGALLNLDVAGSNTGKLTIALNDMLGRTVRLVTVSELQSKMQFDVSELPSGLYSLAVLDQSKQKVFNHSVNIIH